MTRNRIANRRRAAGPRPEPKPMPLQDICGECLKLRYIDGKTGLCKKCTPKAAEKRSIVTLI